MLRDLLAKALSFRLFVLAAALAVAGIGGWTFVNLPIDAYPDIAPTQVKIILKAPGMTPDEVETRILAPIEQEMLGLPKQAVGARTPRSRGTGSLHRRCDVFAPRRARQMTQSGRPRVARSLQGIWAASGESCARALSQPVRWPYRYARR